MTQYRELSDQTKSNLTECRQIEDHLAALCKDIAADPAHDPRQLAVARTQLQGALMWLTRAATNPITNW